MRNSECGIAIKNSGAGQFPPANYRLSVRDETTASRLISTRRFGCICKNYSITGSSLIVSPMESTSIISVV